MKTQIKICGMRRAEDIGFVNEFRPNYAGFILSQGFKRSVDLDCFLKLREMLDRDIKAVGVFVNEPIESILAGYSDSLDVIQLHGDEDEEYIKRLKCVTDCEIWKAVRAKAAQDIERADCLSCDKLLIDSYSENAVGGTGKRVNLKIVRDAAITKPFFMAGGINDENAAEIIQAVKPYGVDFSSSVETNGFKDREKIRRIMQTVRKLTADNCR